LFTSMCLCHQAV